MGVTFRLGHAWARSGNWLSRGSAHVGGELLTSAALAAAFSSSGDQLSHVLSQANGSFAVVRDDPESPFVAVDRIRGFPLWYALAGPDAYISDDPHWISAQLGAEVIDAVAAAEYLLTRYVTGPSDTLHPLIKHVGPGATVKFVRMSHGWHADVQAHYVYQPRFDGTGSERDFAKRWDDVVRQAFSRLVESLGQRQAAIPLSGGNDSRLVALMLKRLGYENVLCFSYGRPGYWEAEVSRQVAAALGFRWEFVPYTPERWHRWYRSEEFSQYRRYAEGLTAVPHLQDWPAVRELQLRGVLSPDAVFVPGHTGDFISGGHIPPELYGKRTPSRPQLIEIMFRRHYRNWRCRDRAVLKAVRARLNEQLGEIGDGREGMAAAIERWDWNGRQAKFVCNSVRAYEFWGYEWRLPLFDAEVMSFWESVPLAYKLRKLLYARHVAELSADLNLRPVPKNLRYRFARSVVYARGPEQLRELIRAVRGLGPHSEYRSHPMAWYGIFDADVFARVYTGRENLNTFLAMDRLGMIRIADGSADRT